MPPGHQALVAALLVAVALVVWTPPWRGAWLATPALAPVGTVATIFLGIVLEALPFLLVGILAATLVEVFVPPAWIERYAPRGRLGGPLAGLGLALVIPVCECGVIPLARRLLQKGAPLPLAMAFLLAAPAANPISIVATAVAFNGDPRFVLGRLAIVWATAALVGVVFSFHPGAALALRPAHAMDPHDHDAAGDASAGGLQRALLRAGDDFVALGRWLMLGALLAAVFQTAFPRGAWPDAGQGLWTSVAAMMVVAALLSICSVVDSFVALGFVQTLPLGAILAFLAFGTMVDLKSVLMYLDAFRRSTVVAIVALCALAVLLGGVLVNVALGY